MVRILFPPAESHSLQVDFCSSGPIGPILDETAIAGLVERHADEAEDFLAARVVSVRPSRRPTWRHRS